MILTRPSTLLLAAVINSPALWSAFVDGQLPVQTALERFLVAVIVAALMVAGLDYITGGYRTETEDAAPSEPAREDAAQPARRATDAARDPEPEPAV